MSEIYYPHEYLPLPLAEGYGFKPVSSIRRTQLSSGRARQRRIYTSTPTNTPVQWLFPKPQQAQLFEAWYRDALTDGAAWFMMKLKSPLGCDEWVKCRFTDIYDGPHLEMPNYWRFSATLELWEKPLLPKNYGLFPEYIVQSDILDIALNREWPEA
ncbi:hypothetical protein LHV18_22775 [Providencia rettgeri]|uniref:hypothetical protein n=1 Tax=Providencia TaxID=586 RepID=UPI001CFD91F9|nr:hypothetical protein [Providencia rettgeri]MCB4843428.1 hypothetical protein [Providencia rettgeri]MCG5277738.1 hypothetical protein [Providencia rettgeri]MCG9508682.1 hypothetical protein [Providencia rettgeri]